MNADHYKLQLDKRPLQRGDPCGCIGPRNGDPVCPCQMQHVTVENGRYVMKRDLGPAKSASCQPTFLAKGPFCQP